MASGDENGGSAAGDECAGIFGFDVIENEEATLAGAFLLEFGDDLRDVAGEAEAELAGEVGADGGEVAALAGEPEDFAEFGLIAMGEFEGEGGFAGAAEGGETDDGAGFEETVESGEFRFAADEERRARGERVDVRWWGGLLGDEKRADLAEAFEVVGAEVEVRFVGEEARDFAVLVEDGEELGAAFGGLLPEGVGPFFADPVGGDGGWGEDEEDVVGVEALGHFGDDVVAGGDFGFVEPDGDLGVFAEVVGEEADEGLVLDGVAEEDRYFGHVKPGAGSYLV